MKLKLPCSFSLIAFLLLQAFTFRLQAQLVANFSSTPPSGCAPISVTFKDLSTGSPTSWSWNFGNGNTSTLQNPSAIYTNPGTYTVTLTISKGGLNNTKTSLIKVFAKPTADFKTSAMPSCVGQTVTFTDASTVGGGPITTWSWDFGDGNIKTTKTGKVTHSYTSGGTYPVSVVVTDTNGCSNSVIHSVTILPSPVAAFTGTPLSSCTAPLTVTFTNSSTTTGAVTYLWRFGDGNTSTTKSPSHTYTSLGTYTVTLIITQGSCIDSIVKTNYVILQKISAHFTSDVTSGCIGTKVKFTDTSIPLSTSRIWDFGDGSPTSTLANPTHTYTAPGTYTVSMLKATANGCSDSIIKVNYITIFPTPVAAFTANNTQSCKAPFTVSFTDQTPNSAGWVWNFGDGSPTSTTQNPVHIYNTPGTYPVSLIVTSKDGCIDTLVKNNYIKISPPIADFFATPREGCAPITVNFNSTSISLVDAIANYNWDFGDGNTGTGSPTSHVYTLPGTYTVRLIITTASGCKDTITKINHIKAGTKPTAKFTVVDSTLCFGMPSGYNNLSTGADSTFWDFGDGTTLPLKLPALDPVAHLYGDTGTFTVRLIVYNKGCPDTLIQPKIETIFPPKPQFTFKLNCTNPYLVKFTDASEGADSLSWDMGDGTIIADSLTITHLYTTRGPKTVTLTAFNFKTGCSFAMQQSFTIAKPIANYTATPNPGCYPLPATFTNTSQDATSVIWHFGDGSRDTTILAGVSHTYILPGTKNSKLVITDVNGCKDSITKKIIVQGPIPNFKADTTIGCAPLPILFTDKSVTDSTIVQWKWSFGDLTTTTTASSPVSHTYTAAGSYTVKMVATDKNGCVDSITKTNYILPTFPVPKFTVLTDTFACKNELLTFKADTTNVAPPGKYKWEFGDGATANGVTTTHTYIAENTYPVTLIVTDKNGCVDSIKHFVVVQHPIVSFDSTMIGEKCSNVQIQFNDHSTGPGSPFTYSWNFGDGASGTGPNPGHTYTVPGTYTVALTVTNSGGCSTTITKNNYVKVPGPVGTFSFSPQTGCNPLTVTFTAVSGNSTVYIWDFGDGSPIVTTTVPTVQHTYKKTITATPQLLLGNTLPDGSPCQAPAPFAGKVVVTTVINVNIDSSVVVLPDGKFFVITSKVSGVTGTPTYSWTPPDGLSCADCLEPYVKGDGSGKTITYYFTVTDPNGCIGIDSIKFIFAACDDNMLIPNVFTPNGDGINDLFEIHGPCETDDYFLRIYDRWGLALFSSTEKNLSWDGRTTAGKQVPDGVYYYILTVNDKSYTGFLQLIR